MEGQFENNGNLCAPQEDYRKPMRKAYCRVEWKIFLYAVIVVAAQTLYAWALPELFGGKCLCCGVVYLGDDDHSHVYDCFSGFIFVNRGQKGPCKNYAA